MVSFPIQAVITAVDKATGPIRRVVSVVENQLGRSLHNVAHTAENVGEKLAGILEPLGLIGAGAGIVGVGELVMKFGELSDVLVDTSIKTGISVQALQELHFAARMSGSSAEEFDKGMTKLNKTIGEAATGKNVEALMLFRKLGIAVRDSSGEIRGAADILPALADAVKNNENPVVRTRIALTSFGKAGAGLIPILSEGSEGLAAFAKEANELGLVSEKDAKAGKKFMDSLVTVHAAIDGITNLIAAGLLPALNPVIEGFIEWAKANRETIAPKITVFISDLITKLRALPWADFIKGVGDCLSSINRFIEATIGWKAALGLVAFMMAAPMLNAFLQFGLALSGLVIRIAAFTVAMTIGPAISSFILAMGAGLGAVEAFNLALYANPIGLVVAALAVLGLAIYELYQHWDTIAAYIGKLWDSIDLTGVGKRILNSLWDGMRSVYDGMVSWFSDKVNALTDVLPNWLKNQLGLGVTVTGQPGDAGSSQGTTTPRDANGSLLPKDQQQKTQLQGEMVVRFDNAPPGMRVQPGAANTPGVEFNADVGYGSLFSGMAY